MLQFSAALLSRALGPLIALLSSPCGRHSTFGRRRRSTRVRRYVPTPLPASAPRLAPPSEDIHAEEVALVRPYFAAHERQRSRTTTPATAPLIPSPRGPEPVTDEVAREFARVQERAAVILQRWRTNPEGDLLSGPAPRFGVVRPTKPATHPPSEWDELAFLSRAWLDQQRQEVPA